MTTQKATDSLKGQNSNSKRVLGHHLVQGSLPGWPQVNYGLKSVLCGFQILPKKTQPNNIKLYYFSTFKNCEITNKNPDFYLFFGSFDIWQHWTHIPKVNRERRTEQGLPLVLLCFLPGFYRHLNLQPQLSNSLIIEVRKLRPSIAR